MTAERRTAPLYRRAMRFAWLPKRLYDGRWIWLRSYRVRLPVH